MISNRFVYLINFFQSNYILFISFIFLLLGIVFLAFWYFLYRLYIKETKQIKKDKILRDIETSPPVVLEVHKPEPLVQHRNKTEWQIGISTGLYYDSDIFQSLPIIKDAGFDVIEIWAGPNKRGSYTHFDWHQEWQVHALDVCIKALNLRVSSLHAPYSEILNIADPDESRRRYTVSEILKTADVLKYLGGEYLIVHPASNDNYLPDRTFRFAQSRKSIEEICRYIKRIGLKLAVENLLPHHLGGDVSTILALIEGLPKDIVGICFDTSHANLYPGNDAVNIFNQFSQRVMTLHLSDNFGHYDDHFSLGDGTINWQLFTNKLRSNNYKGIFMLEILGEPTRSPEQVVLSSVFKRAEKLIS